jgi:membrane fusion protein, multidrug efflux system
MTRCRRSCGHPWGLLSLVALVSCVGVGCTQEAPPAADVIRPVKTLVVAVGESTRERTFPGAVEASRRVELAFQVPGILVKLPVKEGDRVAKGDVIAQLRQDEFQARLDSLQAELDRARAGLAALLAGERPEEQLRREAQVRQAEARLANARADLDRATRLVSSRAISQAEFDRTQATYQVAVEDHQSTIQLAELATVAREEDILGSEATVRGLEARLVEANLQLQDSTLRAPYDGVIAERFVEEGQNIRAKEPVVRFQDVDEVEILVNVPESVMVADIQRADIVELVASLSGAPGLRFPVRIREMAQVADATTQTFQIRTAMQAPEGLQVLPGMTATVTATYRRAGILGQRMLVPVSAVFKRDSGDQVAWIVGADGAVAARPVKTGDVASGQIEVTDGLEPGERIAVAGVSFLRDGMKVRDLGDALGGSQP